MVEKFLKRKKKGGIFVEKKERGITLIALVLTIIVMLILVAVSISVAVNGGLFSKAGKAVKNTEEERDKELTLAAGQINIDNVIYNSIDDYIARRPSTSSSSNEAKWERGTGEETDKIYHTINGIRFNFTMNGQEKEYLTIGDTISYTPDTTLTEVQSTTEQNGCSDPAIQTINREDLTWVVLGIDQNNPSNILITSQAPTTETLTMQGATAYNYAVKEGERPGEFDRICEKLYSKGNIKARSMTIEDVNNCLEFEPTRGIKFVGLGDWQSLPVKEGRRIL